MELLYKPEADEALRRWDAFWQGEMLDRPPVVMSVRRPGAENVPAAGQLVGFEGDFEAAFQIIDAAMASTLHLGDTLPRHSPAWGPDQFAAFLGCEIALNPDSSNTSWVKPCVKDWRQTLPLQLDPENVYWKRMLEFCEYLRPRAKGRWLIGTLDMHANMDGIAAMRGYERMCLDMVDTPELIDQAIEEVCALFPEVYDQVYEAAGMGEVGYTTSWGSMVAPGKTTMLQCDFSALMSPPMFQRWVLPCLEAETEFLDHSAYHLDGPDALCHLPALLSLPRLHCIQWVIGAGLIESRPLTTWIELYQRIQAAGKACQMWGTVEELKAVHKQLKPNLVQYIPTVHTVEEAEGFLRWLVENS